MKNTQDLKTRIILVLIILWLINLLSMINTLPKENTLTIVLSRKLILILYKPINNFNDNSSLTTINSISINNNSAGDRHITREKYVDQLDKETLVRTDQHKNFSKVNLANIKNASSIYLPKHQKHFFMKAYVVDNFALLNNDSKVV